MNVYVGAFEEKEKEKSLSRLPLVERSLDLVRKTELATGKIMQVN